MAPPLLSRSSPSIGKRTAGSSPAKGLVDLSARARMDPGDLTSSDLGPRATDKDGMTITSGMSRF
ncbi:hypothetical protein DAEQUDRAFT_727436 [Daedalea quercina L-15889]|uniref:Uncharacterized protein n=1 Tax=Daedalea quercina L-15889 TaxID=1314783 RepID=A0A165PYJ4_9APHY|nr:hypothetical protein DAEQUDRAFT_727436 [Daedalea quercina L-15889]